MVTTVKTLADLPKGVQKLVVALAELRTQGYEGAHYDTLSTLLAQHVRHVKASAWCGRDLGVLVVEVGGGRSKPSVVSLTELGASLVPVQTARSARP